MIKTATIYERNGPLPDCNAELLTEYPYVIFLLAKVSIFIHSKLPFTKFIPKKHDEKSGFSEKGAMIYGRDIPAIYDHVKNFARIRSICTFVKS